MTDSSRQMPIFEPEDLIHGMYVVDHYISKGGFAQVWKVSTSHSFMPYAMKVLHPHHKKEEKLRFQLERDIMRGLNERHNARTPRVHWAGQAPHPRREEQALEFIVMDYIKGLTLAEVLQRGRDGMSEVCGLHFEKGRMTYSSFLAFMDQLLEGLMDVHALGFVHRDLKPKNIMLSEGSSLNVKLIDFGISKQYSKQLTHLEFIDPESISYERLTEEGHFVMTSHYAAPEQLFEADNANPKTDLFALGLIAYECLVGAAYYGPELVGDDMLKKIVFTINEPIRLPPEIAELAPRVTRLLHSMLEKGMAHRLTIFKDEQGYDLYDLEEDGASLTRLVRQTFHTLGRDADMLASSISSASSRVVSASEVSDLIEPEAETELLNDLPVLDLDTQIRAQTAEMWARQEVAPTQKNRHHFDLERELNDVRTIPLPLKAPSLEMIQAHQHEVEARKEGKKETARLWTRSAQDASFSTEVVEAEEHVEREEAPLTPDTENVPERTPSLEERLPGEMSSVDREEAWTPESRAPSKLLAVAALSVCMAGLAALLVVNITADTVPDAAISSRVAAPLDVVMPGVEPAKRDLTEYIEDASLHVHASSVLASTRSAEAHAQALKDAASRDAVAPHPRPAKQERMEPPVKVTKKKETSPPRDTTSSAPRQGEAPVKTKKTELTQAERDARKKAEQDRMRKALKVWGK